MRQESGLLLKTEKSLYLMKITNIEQHSSMMKIYEESSTIKMDLDLFKCKSDK